MQFKPPKDDNKYQWTQHVKDKMRWYGIFESLIKRIGRFPKRKEEGIAPGTTAVMQAGTNKKKPSEIWVMFRETGQRQVSALTPKTYNLTPRMKIISAWRYPGVSPIRGAIPIPDEIRQEIENELQSDQ